MATKKLDLPHAHLSALHRLRLSLPAFVALLGLGLLYFALPEQLTLGPRWLLLVLEGPMIAFLIVAHRPSLGVDRHIIRIIALAVLGVATVLITVSLILLLNALVSGKGILGSTGLTPRQLLVSAAALWCANIVVFACWYWELDRGGPHRRHLPDPPAPDFLFPQQSGPDVAPPDWCPTFVDYLFVGFTNATAFSPTDTLPLTPRIKLLMMLQAFTSLLTVAVVAARAINILNT